MKRVGILIFDQVEVLDFCGPFEVFGRAHVLDGQARSEPLFDVLLIAETLEPVSTFRGMRVLPTHTLATHPELEVLLIPGGPGVRALLGHAPVLDWLRSTAGRAEVTCSVCTGALLLAAAGLLDGRRATTHWRSLDLLESHSTIEVVRDQRVVLDGDVVTSAGVTAGIDLALHVTQLLHGPEVAADVAQVIEYPEISHEQG